MPTNPTTPDAAERARFEAWAKSQHYNLGRDKYGGYASIASHAAWAAWQAALAAQEGGGERVTDVRRFEDLVFIGLDAYRNWRSELEADGSDVTIADRNMAGLIVALRAALRAAQEGTGNG